MGQFALSPVPIFADWDGDGSTDLVLTGTDKVQYFQRGVCTPSSPYCQQGTCSKQTSQCDCIPGTEGPDCSLCGEFHVRDEGTGTCRKCPGYDSLAGTCSRRGRWGTPGIIRNWTLLNVKAACTEELSHGSIRSCAEKKCLTEEVTWKRSALIPSFLHPFTPSLPHSFTPSFLHSFVRSSIHPLIHSPMHPFIRLFVRSPNHACIQSFPVHSFNHAWVHSCIHWFIPWFFIVSMRDHSSFDHWRFDARLISWRFASFDFISSMIHVTHWCISLRRLIQWFVHSQWFPLAATLSKIPPWHGQALLEFLTEFGAATCFPWFGPWPFMLQVVSFLHHGYKPPQKNPYCCFLPRLPDEGL